MRNMTSGAVNWSLCCLCQADTSGETICPALNPNSKSRGKGYISLSMSLSSFSDSSVPMNIPDSLMNDENLQQTLMDNHATFHKSCLNKLTRVDRKGKRPYDTTEEPEHASPAKTRKMHRNSFCSTSRSGGSLSDFCLFCGIDDSDNELHSVTSSECDLNVRAWATDMEDFDIIGKLANGDLFAHDAVYHKDCMTTYYTLHRSYLREKNSEGNLSQSQMEALALAETVAYVTDDDSDGPFYITDLAEFFKTRLIELGGRASDRIHTTRFQDRILSQMPWMSGTKDGNKLYIACEEAIGKAAARDLHRNPDQDACNMTETASHIRELIFDSQQGFSGEFGVNAQEKSVPCALASFLDMILCGPSVKHNTEADENRKAAALSIAQLLIYNAVKKAPTQATVNKRYNVESETPLAVYIALKI